MENLSGDQIDLGTVDVGSLPVITQVLINGSDLYSGRWAAETSDGSNITSNVAAGETATVYLFISIPCDTAENMEQATLLVGFDDFDKAVSALFTGGDSWESCAYKYCVELPVAE